MGFKQNNPGCNCCDTIECADCISVPSTVSTTFSGIANGDGSGIGCVVCTNCTDLNSTYVLDQFSECTWKYNESPFCGPSTTLEIIAKRQLDRWEVSLQVYNGCFSTVRFKGTVDAGTIDCTASEVLTRDVSPSPGTAVCDLSSATCQIN